MPNIPPIKSLARKKKFERDLKGLAPSIQLAVKDAVEDLLRDPIPAVRRVHSLSGFKNPKIYTIDVFSNKSYKISFELDGGIATLRRIASHKEIDDAP